MYMIIMSLNLMMSIIFMFMNHPMSMGLILLIQTIMIVLISSFYSYSFWFSYILFLIMIGGMLILFMYMTSLASNEKFNMSKNMMFIMITIMTTLLILMWMNDPMLMNYMHKNSNLIEFIDSPNLYKNENLFSINMMYNKPNMYITIMMINYLLITLIATVKITKSSKGPLRQKF
uniref:NADH-ubiquinone oxidoreductase chain 6 n=1 Tax=Heterosternuta allegheniana TaxID=2714604 RepID=A0A894JVM6_9DYTI|nr:NADH dehydrogenase subunit 6 [Heterosternuta allegheniana]